MLKTNAPALVDLDSERAGEYCQYALRIIGNKQEGEANPDTLKYNTEWQQELYF